MRIKKNKDTVLLFMEIRDSIDFLTDEDAGRLFKAILAYAEEGVIPDFQGPLMSVFSLVKSQIDRGEEAYIEKCIKNRINSLKRPVMQKKLKEMMEAEGVTPDNTDEFLRKLFFPVDIDRYLPMLTDILPKPNPKPKPSPKPDIDDGVNTPIINENKDVVEVIVEEDFPFDKIWEMYDKKVGNVAALRETWKTLSADEKRNIFEYVPTYVRVRPDRKYRKNFENFLACRTWETEPIPLNELINGNKNYRNSPQSKEERRELAQQNSLQLVSKLLGGNDESAASFDDGEEDVPYSS